MINIEQLKNYGVPTENIWNILIKQAEVNVYQNLLYIFITIGLTTMLLKKAIKILNESTEDVIKMWLVIMCFAGVLGFSYITYEMGIECIVNYFNPEYWALTQLIK